MSPTPLSFGLFDPTYVMVVPAVVFLAFVLAYIPSMMMSSAKPEAIGKAIACYLMKTFGMVLMIASALQVIYDMMYSTLPPMSIVASLLLVFLVGMGIVVHYSGVVESLDENAVVIPRAIFSHGFEVLGAVITVLSALSLMLTFLITQSVDGWELPATSLLAGLMITLLFSVHIETKNRKRAKRSKR